MSDTANRPDNSVRRKELLSIADAAENDESLSPEALENLRSWIQEDRYAEWLDEIADLLHTKDWATLEDSFYTFIPFGTGGRRGKRGCGPNRINLRTIGESAQGLAAYIEHTSPDAKASGVAISHDTRYGSRPFAEECARVLAANGVKAYLFDSHRSTPELSFAIRHLGCVAGIMISASHNPPSDNGIKVSWTDGGQVLPPHDKGIIERVQAVTDIPRMSLEDGRAQGLIVDIGEQEVDRAYVDATTGVALGDARDARIVFTPLHGVGATNVARSLNDCGFDVEVLASQAEPDPEFTTVPNQLPNPEFPEALELATQRANESGADLVLASDPDADRLGAAIRVPKEIRDSGWLPLTGNQLGALSCAYLVETLQRDEKLLPTGVLVKTAVTTDAIKAIAEEYGLSTVHDLPVGFKYIAQVIEELEAPQEFVFGMEESHGYLAGTWVRDKDAAHAGILLSELASREKAAGSSIFSYLCNFYRRFGLFVEVTISEKHEGRAGAEYISSMLETLRNNPPTTIGGTDVLQVIDRKVGLRFSPEAPSTRVSSGGINANMIVLEFSDNGRNRLTIRPSGTEPKVKMYVQLWDGEVGKLSDVQLFARMAEMQESAKQLIHELGVAVRAKA